MPGPASYCRFCAIEKAQESLISIKNNKNLQYSVKEKMHIFKDQIIDFSNEKLPENICTECLDSLNKCYEFFVQSKDSQDILNAMFLDEQNDIEASSEVDNLEFIKEENNYIGLYCWANRDTNSDALDDSWSSYPWHCSHCGTNIPTMQDLRIHNQEQHGVCCMFHCMDCEEPAVGFDEFVDHVKVHRPSLSKYCQYCNIKLESPAHIDTHKYNCNMCGHPFTHKSSLLTHLQKYNFKRNESSKKKQENSKNKFKAKDIVKKIKESSLSKKNESCSNNHNLNKIPLPPLYDTKHQRLLPTAESENDPDTKDDKKLNIETTVPTTSVKEEDSTKIEVWSDYPHICKYCGLKVDGFTILKTHCISFHKKCFGMKCIDCENDDSNTLENFAQHVFEHRPNLISCCHFCYTPISESDRQYHLLTHKSRFQCSACSQHFKNMRDFRCHDNKLEPPLLKPPVKRRKLPISEEEVVCNICYFKAKSPWFLKKHKQIHTERKRDFTCERCGKAFLSKSTLDGHTKMHKLQERDPKEMCKICSKAFYTIRQLREHVKNHNLVMPFQCDDCKKLFRSKDSLRGHMTVHMDIKPFSCKYCQKKFKVRKHMQNHEYQHTGARPFSCEICCLNFTCWSNCDKHLKRIHGMSLAKATVTPHGKMEIDPATGKPKELSITNDLQEWTKNLINAKKGKRKKATCKTEELPMLSGL